MLLKEGKPFFDAFFGYHNFQRYTSVVNNHGEPFWFFIMISFISSLPFSHILIKNIIQSFYLKNQTLMTLCVSWFLAVLIFFSISQTKLPSYWLPAIPAASIIIGLTIEKESIYFNSILLIIIIIVYFIFKFLFLEKEILYDPDDPEMAKIIEK